MLGLACSPFHLQLALQDLRPRVGLSYTLPLLTNDSQVGGTGVWAPRHPVRE